MALMTVKPGKPGNDLGFCPFVYKENDRSQFLFGALVYVPIRDESISMAQRGWYFGAGSDRSLPGAGAPAEMENVYVRVGCWKMW